jgi:hypothetical protein
LEFIKAKAAKQALYKWREGERAARARFFQSNHPAAAAIG